MEDNGLAPLVEDDANQDEESKLVGDLKGLRLDPVHQRFFGKSSGIMLIRAAIDLKKEYTGKEDRPKDSIMPSKRPEFWNVCPVSDYFSR